MYKVLRAISCGEEVEVGDVVLSYIYDNNSVYFQIGEKQYHFFSLDEGEPKGFNKWFEEIEYAYYYDSEEKRVRSIDIEEAHNLNLDDRKECFADEDKALELLEEDKNINLPKNLEFKTFATSYIPNLYGEHSEYSSEPLEIRFDDMKFLLEVGRGFSFVARQKRFTFDGRHFRIDLVFYNYILKCFVLIDLKIGDLTHQDLGQMQMYVHYYEREMMNEGDNPPIGIVLCADKSDSIVKYTLPEDEKQIFASKYKLYLPSEEELLNELNKEYLTIESYADKEKDKKLK